MNRWVLSILGGAVIAILAILVLWFFGKQHNSVRRVDVKTNIDISGAGHLASPGVITSLIKQRLSLAGYECSFKQTHKDSLTVSIPGVTVNDAFLFPSILVSNSSIQFRELYNVGEIAPVIDPLNKIASRIINANVSATIGEPDTLKERLTDKVSEISIRNHDSTGIFGFVEFLNPAYSQNERLSYPSAVGRVAVNDTVLLNSIWRDTTFRARAIYDMRFMYGPDNDSREKGKYLYLYAIRTRGKQKAALEKEDIEYVEASVTEGGLPELIIQFKAAGSRKWAFMTRENIGKSIAIIVDDYVLVAPSVANEIVEGNSSIAGGLTTEEVRKFAIRLSSVELPEGLQVSGQQVKPVPSKNMRNLILFGLVGFIVGSGAIYLLINMLKNSD